MSTLWLVATPIGNLGDLAPRAIDVLGRVELVCCEDTRRTGLLLQHAGVRAKRLAVCNEHTEFARLDEVLDVLGAGGDVAVVSDAGMPGVSDPGERLVVGAIDAGHDVSAVPGPSAAPMALTVSGFATGRFVFEGFLPRKGRERVERLGEIASEARTTVLYESPRRVVKTLADLAAACGDDRRVSVSRELTKLYEQTVRSTLGAIDLGEPRGEYVIVLEGRRSVEVPALDDDVRSSLRAAIASGSTKRDAIAEVVAASGRPKRDVYAIAVSLDEPRHDAARTDQHEQINPGGTTA
ncbi:MAG: 16S rRNA (cytidine(1402)-2'-O)-methyltransferase [Ilumatobacter sp.]|jgi:16S rRNA (cytidine1402-2'-O)-methyltransferase|uniref:16S rRNA (cytidine(1402)-2'-O)-methyltransferase n=1 Tax=Ilumatobacter sp. TaxID=1967498 RepID=UPI00391AA2EC